MDTTHYCLACSVEMRHPNAVYGQRWHQTWLGDHQCKLFCQRLCMHCLPSSMWQCSLALLLCPYLLFQLTQCCTCAAAELQSCTLSNFFLPGALSVIFRWEASTQRAQILKISRLCIYVWCDYHSGQPMQELCCTGWFCDCNRLVQFRVTSTKAVLQPVLQFGYWLLGKRYR